MDDLISRQAAIDALARTAREKFNLSYEYSHYLGGLMDGELAIKELPTIQPEPTDEQVAEYCKKRCMHLVTNDFFRIGKIEVNEVGHDEGE